MEHGLRRDADDHALQRRARRDRGRAPGQRAARRPASTTVAAKAYLGPSIGRLVPYGGLGAGVYLESLPGDDDQGTTGLVFVGAKLKFPVGLVLRGEYQWVDMPDAAPLQLDHRYFFAVGLGLLRRPPGPSRRCYTSSRPWSS